MSSVPGLTASQDSDRLVKVPGPHVPSFGKFCPAGTGKPPPTVGVLATWLVTETLDCQSDGPACADSANRPDAKTTMKMTGAVRRRRTTWDI